MTGCQCHVCTYMGFVLFSLVFFPLFLLIQRLLTATTFVFDVVVAGFCVCVCVCVALVLICFNAEIPTHAHSHRTEWCIMEFSLLKLTPCADFDEQINMKLRFHSSSIWEMLWCDVNVNADTPQKPFTFFFPSSHREHFPDNVLMLFQAENVVIILVTLPYDLTFKNVHHFSIPRRKWSKLGFSLEFVFESITCFICRQTTSKYILGFPLSWWKPSIKPDLLADI